nr:NADH dehydrogenase subunit 2 [Glossina austeni]
MFNNSSKIMFLFTLFLGSLITISSNSWLGAWMGLEINLLSFIPLMSDSKLLSTEASLKYFLTQALASSILLFSIIMIYIEFNSNSNLNEIMISSTLLLKSGSAPFHFWFPTVMEGLSWMNSLLLLTWQKLAPLMLISYCLSNLLIISMILSALIGAIGGLNQTSLRKLMAYSSINHLGWMISSMYLNNLFWMLYFLMYSFFSFALIFMFNTFKTSHINQLFSLFMNSKTMKFMLFFNLLSLGGLPPFLGFFPKWIVIQMLITNNQLLILFILMMSTLITLYFYLRLSYSAFMMNYPENNWNNNSFFMNLNMKIMLVCSFYSSIGLFLICSIFFIY